MRTLHRQRLEPERRFSSGRSARGFVFPIRFDERTISTLDHHRFALWIDFLLLEDFSSLPTYSNEIQLKTTIKLGKKKRLGLDQVPLQVEWKLDRN